MVFGTRWEFNSRSQYLYTKSSTFTPLYTTSSFAKFAGFGKTKAIFVAEIQFFFTLLKNVWSWGNTYQKLELLFISLENLSILASFYQVYTIPYSLFIYHILGCFIWYN